MPPLKSEKKREGGFMMKINEISYVFTLAARHDVRYPVSVCTD